MFAGILPPGLQGHGAELRVGNSSEVRWRHVAQVACRGRVVAWPFWPGHINCRRGPHRHPPL
jgi:hypothetical protein